MYLQEYTGLQNTHWIIQYKESKHFENSEKNFIKTITNSEMP